MGHTIMTFRTTLFATVGAAAMMATTVAHATTLEITVTHNGNTGLFITPLYTSFHDGTYDAFNVGDAASDGLAEIAETGSPAAIAAERQLAAPGSKGLFLPDGTGPGPIFPTAAGIGAGSASGTIDVDGAANQYFSFLAMILPSNDHFIGADDPLSYQLFDDFGAFLGPIDINVTGLNVYDAGSEANDATANGGGAFVAGADINAGGTGEGSVQQGIDLNAFAGIGLAPPPALDNVIGILGEGGFAGTIDFTSDPRAFDFLTISIREVAPVPLPASAPLLAGALGLMGWGARRRKARG